jgi:hypothetical protein
MSLKYFGASWDIVGLKRILRFSETSRISLGEPGERVWENREN